MQSCKQWNASILLHFHLLLLLLFVVIAIAIAIAASIAAIADAAAIAAIAAAKFKFTSLIQESETAYWCHKSDTKSLLIFLKLKYGIVKFLSNNSASPIDKVAT